MGVRHGLWPYDNRWGPWTHSPISFRISGWQPGLRGVLVVLELFAICWIRWKYMETPFTSALVQVVLGGALVLLIGIASGRQRLGRVFSIVSALALTITDCFTYSS